MSPQTLLLQEKSAKQAIFRQRGSATLAPRISVFPSLSTAEMGLAQAGLSSSLFFSLFLCVILVSQEFMTTRANSLAVKHMMDGFHPMSHFALHEPSLLDQVSKSVLRQRKLLSYPSLLFQKD
mmetsp:Transcript_89498/g.186980  ORF Transcript_89498/g.186980 Transcript_89498/m.186980 type:complete len:123 (-) Transcript_89498:234-602(-)